MLKASSVVSGCKVGAARLPAKVSGRIARSLAVCHAQNGREAAPKKAALPVAALVAMSLLASSIAPDYAEAAKSGGRVGGSSFSARKAAPARSGAAAGGGGTFKRRYAPAVGPSGQVRSGSRVVVAPQVVAPPMFGFGFGIPIFPSFGFGIGMGIGSAIFQFMLISMVVAVVASAVQGLASRRKDQEDGW